jgi:uncharacterized protein (DUF1778 family)
MKNKRKVNKIAVKVILSKQEAAFMSMAAVLQQLSKSNYVRKVVIENAAQTIEENKSV